MATIAEILERSATLGLYPDLWVEANFPGVKLRKWQKKILEQLGESVRSGKCRKLPFRKVVSSGNGPGKSALVAWIICWAMGTRKDTRGIVTASTEGQLETKTWPEVTKWYHQWILKPFFAISATRLWFTGAGGHETSWRWDAVTNNPKNEASFQGLHNEGNRIGVIFDEASGIAENIYEAKEGFFTDAGTEMFFFAFGNPNEASGPFIDCLYDKIHNGECINSMEVEGTNKELFQQWIDKYGVDSDFCKIHIYGTPPSKGGSGIFSAADLDVAFGRERKDDKLWPWIMGVDIGMNQDQTVFSFRQGDDFWSRPQVEFNGLQTQGIVDQIVFYANQFNYQHVYIDKTGIGKGVSDLAVEALPGRDVRGVNFGQDAYDKGLYLNMRAEMYYKAEKWIRDGGVMGENEKLRQELLAITKGNAPDNNKDQRLRLEDKRSMRARGLPSPDHADSFVLTFAHPVASTYANQRPVKIRQDNSWSSQNVFRS